MQFYKYQFFPNNFPYFLIMAAEDIWNSMVHTGCIKQEMNWMIFMDHFQLKIFNDSMYQEESSWF